MIANPDVPLMPKATAVWLVDNTSLSFEQIAAFCRLHPLEVKAIADGDAAQGIKGLDPVLTGQLSREEIAKGESNPQHRLKLSQQRVVAAPKKRRGPRYTPVSKRQDRPNAILWLLRNHGELKDAQIIRLVGTTKTTIQAIRERSHWNSANLQPVDPVSLGLCTQIDLDAEVEKAARDSGAARPQPAAGAPGGRLMPVEESVQPDIPHHDPYAGQSESLDPEAVFSGLRAFRKKDGEEEDDDPQPDLP